MPTSHETILYIDLKALEKNYKYLKNKLKSETKIIAVVKAFAYGHGDITIAKKLEELGVDAFWVADFEEGMNLRKAGISRKIIVANPGIKGYKEIVKYNLEPVIYNFRLLEIFGKNNIPISVHIKFNTGMNRYGFNLEEVEVLTKKLKEFPHLKIESICSHLAAATDKSKDDFTQKQFEKFDTICKLFTETLNIKSERHILNTAGVLRFTSQQNNMVRLGIGLYGIGEDDNLQVVAKLVSTISQIRNLKQGEKVGYDASFITEKEMRIAVIPLGYADGINRKLGNEKGKVLINNVFANIIGEISMDSLMVDISSINAKEGDLVTVFGTGYKVSDIAKNLNTIAYEILATLNRRIKRVYLN